MRRITMWILHNVLSWPLQRIGDKYEISRQRVWQILKGK